MVYNHQFTRLYKVWLCLPFALLSLCDTAITLYGQSPRYWEGDWQTANEAFPVFAYALHNGPEVFLWASLFWMLAFSLLIIGLPRLMSEVLALALVNGHTWGIMTWLIYVLQINYYLGLGFFLIAATVFILCYRRYQLQATVA